MGVIRKKQSESQEIIYSTYQLSWKEEGLCAGTGLVITGITAWLLYQNAWGILLGIVILPLWRKSYRNTRIEKQKRELLFQFKEAMQSVSIALLSGFSIENAWQEAEKEMRELYGDTAFMTQELKQMNGAIKFNQTIEQQLYQFALRSDCEDIRSFAEVFCFAKRSGGNFAKIIQNTVLRICEKMEVEREIETVIAGKKMEQKIMNIVPVGLLGYLNLTSGDFMAPLYGNLAGAAVMTGAFTVYVGAVFLAKRMVAVRI